MSIEQPTQEIYELSINLRVAWQAHSLSNAGNNGSNRTLPRRQFLADGSEIDACSGNIAKHHHAALLTEYAEAGDLPLCPACKARDGRRAAALVNHPDYPILSLERILPTCVICDAHGFLVTAKNEDGENGTGARQRVSKHTLIDFSYALALPGLFKETIQLHTRTGPSKEEGQMLMKMPSRSGEYALGIRYYCVGIGADTERRSFLLTDELQRRRRHQAILRALRDTLLSPEGALTATMLPHLTGLVGTIVMINTVGRAPIYSALQPDFIARLQAMQTDTLRVSSFETIDAFYTQMNQLIETSIPATPAVWKMLPTQAEDTELDQRIKQGEKS